MTRPLLAICLAIALTSGLKLDAQSFTSPKGFEITEGDASHFALFNPNYERFMQIDNTLVGSAVPSINAIAFRQDSERTSAGGNQHTLDLTILLGHADYSQLSGTFASNYKGPATIVFTKKPVNTPNWSQLPSTRPAPFGLRLVLDTKWSYNGQDAFAYELHMENVSGQTSPHVDRELGSSSLFNQALGQSLGLGCLVQNRGIEMGHFLELRNYGPSHAQFGMRLGAKIARAPGKAATVLNLDTVDSNLTVPGLCSTLHCLPVLSLALPLTDVNGEIPTVFTDLPYLSAIEGITFYTQALSLDASRPGIAVSVSDAQVARMPDAARVSPQASYLYAPLVTSASSSLWADRAIVTRFDY